MEGAAAGDGSDLIDWRLSTEWAEREGEEGGMAAACVASRSHVYPTIIFPTKALLAAVSPSPTPTFSSKRFTLRRSAASNR